MSGALGSCWMRIKCTILSSVSGFYLDAGLHFLSLTSMEESTSAIVHLVVLELQRTGNNLSDYKQDIAPMGHHYTKMPQEKMAKLNKDKKNITNWRVFNSMKWSSDVDVMIMCRRKVLQLVLNFINFDDNSCKIWDVKLVHYLTLTRILTFHKYVNIFATEVLRILCYVNSTVECFLMLYKQSTIWNQTESIPCILMFVDM